MSETLPPFVIDKSDWGKGEWNEEPDRVDFVFGGLACFALRHPSMGFWCGYVGVPREHPLYGRDWIKGLGVDLEVHGGVNYSAPCEEGGLICHRPRPGMPADVWWIGFACGGGLFDLAPAMRARERAMGLPPIEEMIDTPEWLRERYRDLRYVRHEIEHLAVQLAAMMPSHALTAAPAGAA